MGKAIVAGGRAVAAEMIRKAERPMIVAKRWLFLQQGLGYLEGVGGEDSIASSGESQES